MSDTNAHAASAPEPTMEEILASIRRIISEDDAPAAAAPEPAPEPAPVAAASPPPAPPPPATEPEDDDVLELTDPVEPAPIPEPPKAEPAPVAHNPHFEESLGDLDVFSSAPPPPPKPAPADEPLVGSYAAQSSASHFGALAKTVAMPKDGRSLEDVVRELLKPLLADWLDRNLAAIVEARVQAEVERIARRSDY